jgi:large conductance mechanosensitive channel
MPMNHMIERRNRRLGIGAEVKEEAAEDPQIALLTEIRDSLQARPRA